MTGNPPNEFNNHILIDASFKKLRVLSIEQQNLKGIKYDCVVMTLPFAISAGHLP